MIASRAARACLGLALASLVLPPPGRAQDPETPAAPAPPEPAAPDEDPPAPPAAPRKTSEPEALAAIDAMWESMGGRTKFDAIRYLRFEFELELDGKVAARRSHLVDLGRQKDRMEIQTNRGTFVALVDRKARSGRSFENGEEVPEKDRAAVLARVLEYCEADLNWLLLPWRAKEGVLTLAEAPAAGEHEKQAVRLDAQGFLPGERFELVLDRASERLESMKVWMNGAPADAEPLAFACLGWVEAGGVQFSTEKAGLNNGYRVRIKDLRVETEVAEDAFTAP